MKKVSKSKVKKVVAAPKVKKVVAAPKAKKVVVAPKVEKVDEAPKFEPKFDISKVILMPQTRAHRDEATVERYIISWKEDRDNMPAVHLFSSDGKAFFAGDGTYRLTAALKAGIKTVKAWIHKGGEREAYLFSLTANDAHGNPSSFEDKKKQVETLLQDTEWSMWSNNVIAKRCGVSGPTVAKVAEELGLDRKGKPHKAVRNGKEYEVDPAGIGDRSKRQGEKPQKVAPAKEVKGDPPARPQEPPPPASDAADDGILDAAMKQVSPPTDAVSGGEPIAMAPTAVAENSIPTAPATDSTSSEPVDESKADEVKSANVIVEEELVYLFDSEDEADEGQVELRFRFKAELAEKYKKSIWSLHEKLGGSARVSKSISATWKDVKDFVLARNERLEMTNQPK